LHGACSCHIAHAAMPVIRLQHVLFMLCGTVLSVFTVQVFRHLHNLDLQFHLNRQTGTQAGHGSFTWHRLSLV
jgi:hypothetical protein